ncbi:MAG TPA: hypothetical protein VK183_03405 [Flavobacterium sp.]|nr:hypothetical protein [Flavobacterium sp.]
MNYHSILTGDVIHSRQKGPETWLEALRDLLSRKGKDALQWDIYRGDEFQVEIADPADALSAAIEIRALLRTMGLDARISIGIGEKTYSGDKISQSNGSAFVRSGELFERLKQQKMTLGINSGIPDFDEPLNLMLRLATPIIATWLPPQATYALAALQYPDLSQEELGQRLDINQAAVSGRRKRSQFELLRELDAYYRSHLKHYMP